MGFQFLLAKEQEVGGLNGNREAGETQASNMLTSLPKFYSQISKTFPSTIIPEWTVFPHTHMGFPIVSCQMPGDLNMAVEPGEGIVWKL